jgi:hypothetical protein
VTFEAIEKQGVDGFLEQIRDRHTRADAIESVRFRLFGKIASRVAIAIADPATSTASVPFASSEIRDHPLRRGAR